MLETHVNNYIYNKYCLLHDACHLQIICRYISLHNKNIIASTDVALNFVILTKNSVLPIMPTFEMALIFLSER